MTVAPAPARKAGGFSARYRGYYVAVLVTVSSFAILDRVALLTVGQAIKQDLRLTDFQFGLVSGFAFAVIYTLMGLPLARIADTSNRVRLISVAVAVWSLFSLASGLARNFFHLMVCRIVIGIGEAGVQPPAIAILSDLYPPERRGTALALLSTGVPIGTLIGAVGAGYLAEAYSWRTVFLILGVPGVILALIVWLTLRDPPRGLSEGKTLEGPAPGMSAVFRHLGARRSFRHIFIGLSLTYVAAAGIGSFMPQFFARVFSLSLGQTGLMFGLVASTSSLVGNVSGGVLVDWISRRDERWYVWLSGWGILLAAPLYVASFIVGNAIIATSVLLVGGMVLFLHSAPSQAVLQNMVEPRMRATAAFIFFFIVSMLGYGVGPTLLGLISDFLAAHAFTLGDYTAMCPGGLAAKDAAPPLAGACHTASVLGIRGAMSTMACLFFWAAIHFFLAAKTLRADLVSRATEGGAPLPGSNL